MNKTQTDTTKSQHQPKTFEYKMCKKVAELTSVINTIFMKSTEADSKNKVVIQNLENEIKNLVNEFKNRENEIIQSYTLKIENLEKQIASSAKHHEEPFTIKNAENKVMKDFSCQYPSVTISFKDSDSPENDIEKNNISIEKIKQMNNHLKVKVNKIEAKLLNERALNLRLITKLRQIEATKKETRNNSRKDSSRKNSPDKVLQRVQTISGIDAQYNSREIVSVRSSMVYSNHGEFIVIHPNKKKPKHQSENEERKTQGEETKMIRLENKNGVKSTSSSQNKDSDYDRNLILRLHNKLLKFPELKQFAK